VQFQSEAQVGFVRAVAGDGFVISQARKGLQHALVRAGFNHPDVEFLDEVQDVVLGDERHFEVELGEFGLAVGAGVFVAEAAGDLEVPLHACDHQQLLELLRRLRQRVELAWIQAAGHEVVARAFRRAFDENGRFDLQKAARGEEVAHILHDAVAQLETLVHRGAAQV
jgi:hypothetical protein